MTLSLTRREALFRSSLLLGAAAMPKSLSAALNANELATRPGYIIRAGTNENPYGMSRVALNAVYNNLDKSSHYNFRARQELHGVISDLNDLPKEQVTIGSGSGEILEVASLIANMESGSVVTPDPTFQQILRYARSMGSEIIRVPVRSDMNIDLAAMKRAIRKDTRLVYIVNPNNPIPSIVAKKELEEFVLEVSQKCMVLVDEAYYEFVEDPSYSSMIGLVREGHKNILVSRTASKIHGMAGLRIGFGFAHPDHIKDIEAKGTGSLNILAVTAATASYQDDEFQNFTRRNLRQSKVMVEDMVKELGLKSTPSHANFVFFDTGRDLRTVNEKLLERGIKVGRPFPPFKTWSRVSMVKPDDMRYYVQTYKELFG
jgi:histidinol-phosphate aminotransferase